MMRVISALSDPIPHRDVQVGVAALLVFGVMSVTTSLLYLWIRAELGGPGALPILATTAFAFAPMLIWILGLAFRQDGLVASLLPVALVSFASLIMLPALWFLPFGRWIAGGVLLVLVAIAFLPIRASLLQMPLAQRLLLVLTGILCGIGFPLWQNAYTYSHVFGPEAAFTGLQHADPIFHAALSEMLLQFGRMSTGLDGVASTPYHVLSHGWVGLTGRLLGVSTLEAYMLVPPLIGVPTLLFALVAAAGQTLPEEERTGFIPALPVLALLLALMLFEVLDWGAYVASESYLFALIGFAFGLAALLDGLKGESRGWLSPALAALLTLLMMASKLSVGLIFACGAFWYYFRQRQARLWVVALWGLLLAGLALGFIWLTASSAHTGFAAFEPLHYVRAYRDHVNVIVCSAALVLAGGLWAFVSREARIGLETLAILVLAAAIPALSLRIGGGSAYYFIHAGSVAALLLAVRLLLSLPVENRRFAPAIPIFMGLVALAAVVMTERKSMAWTTIEARARAVVENIKAYPGVAIVASEKSVLRQPIQAFRSLDVAASLAASFGADLRNAASGIPPAARGRALIFVPPENTAFWRANPLCRNPPLGVPAITGVPMLLGLPPAEQACDLNIFYGYPDYPQPGATSRTMDDGELCRRTKERGFSGVFSLQTMGSGRWIACS